MNQYTRHTPWKRVTHRQLADEIARLAAVMEALLERIDSIFPQDEPLIGLEIRAGNPSPNPSPKE